MGRKKHNCDFNMNVSKLVASEFEKKRKRGFTRGIDITEPLLEKLNRINPWRLVSRSTIITEPMLDDSHWADIQHEAVVGYGGEQGFSPPTQEQPEGVSRSVATAAPEVETSATPQSTDRPEIQSEEVAEPDLRLLEFLKQLKKLDLNHLAEVIKQKQNGTSSPVSGDTEEGFLAQLENLDFGHLAEAVQQKLNASSIPVSEITGENFLAQLKNLDLDHLIEPVKKKRNVANISVSGDTEKGCLAQLKSLDFGNVTEPVKQKQNVTATPVSGDTEDCLEQLKNLDFSDLTETVKKRLRAAGIPVYGDTEEDCMSQQKKLDLSYLTQVIRKKLKAAGIPISEDTEEDYMTQLKRLELDQLTEVVKRKLKAARIPTSGDIEEDYKYLEYCALSESHGKSSGELVTIPQTIDDYNDFVRKYVRSITLVEKLAEISTLTGFSMIKLPMHKEFDWQDQAQLSPQPKQWLPAVRVHGEGIFFTLNKIEADIWGRTKMASRYRAVIANHTPLYTNISHTPRELPPLFFLLHTLAHILIRHLSLKCGYDISSLRERIYCREQRGKEMYGLLIYTASGDRGTTSGLAQQGKPGCFEDLLLRSIEGALWCHSDPLCIESHGQGIDSLNLAACHACALLPETCCEEDNHFLDRAALIGTPHEPYLGFFADTVQEIRSVLL